MNCEVEYYKTLQGREPVWEWLENLEGYALKGRIRRRIELLQIGHLGDFRSVGHGICELRIDTGPGYRVYFARKDPTYFLLLNAGDKNSQRKDIVKAYWYWEEFRRRND